MLSREANGVTDIEPTHHRLQTQLRQRTAQLNKALSSVHASHSTVKSLQQQVAAHREREAALEREAEALLRRLHEQNGPPATLDEGDRHAAVRKLRAALAGSNNRVASLERSLRVMASRNKRLKAKLKLCPGDRSDTGSDGDVDSAKENLSTRFDVASVMPESPGAARRHSAGVAAAKPTWAPRFGGEDEDGQRGALRPHPVAASPASVSPAPAHASPQQGFTAPRARKSPQRLSASRPQRLPRTQKTTEWAFDLQAAAAAAAVATAAAAAVTWWGMGRYSPWRPTRHPNVDDVQTTQTNQDPTPAGVAASASTSGHRRPITLPVVRAEHVLRLQNQHRRRRRLPLRNVGAVGHRRPDGAVTAVGTALDILKCGGTATTSSTAGRAASVPGGKAPLLTTRLRPCFGTTHGIPGLWR